MKIIKWTDQNALPSEMGRYKLTADVTIDRTWEIQSEIFLDLNGYGVKGVGLGNVICVKAGGILVLKDGNRQKQHYYSFHGNAISEISDVAIDSGNQVRFSGGFIASCFLKEDRNRVSNACVLAVDGGQVFIMGGTILAGEENGGEAVRVMEHMPDYSFTASENILTAVSRETDENNNPRRILSLELIPPELKIYGDGGKKEASLRGIADFKKLTGLRVSENWIEYYKGDSRLDEPPQNAGRYIAKLTVGEQTISLEYTISKAQVCVLVLPGAKRELVYNGKEQTIVTGGSVQNGRMEYRIDAGEWTSTIPVRKNAGEYEVWYRIIGDENYSDSMPVKLSEKALIEQKEIHVSGITAENKKYDRTNKVRLSYSGVVFEGVEVGDTLTVTAKGRFHDPEPAENKVVYISEVQLEGASAENYRIGEGTKFVTTADILPKEKNKLSKMRRWRK